MKVAKVVFVGKKSTTALIPQCLDQDDMSQNSMSKIGGSSSVIIKKGQKEKKTFYQKDYMREPYINKFLMLS